MSQRLSFNLPKLHSNDISAFLYHNIYFSDIHTICEGKPVNLPNF